MPQSLLAGDEHRGHVDGAAGEQLQLGGIARPPVRQRYHCSPPWKPVRAIFGGCTPQARARAASGRRRSAAGGGHLGRHRRGHVLVQVHDVVGRQLRQFLGGPRRQREWLVLRPVGALVVVVGAQEGVHALRAVPHVGVGRRGSSSTTGNACAAGRSAASAAWMSARRGAPRRGGVERQRRRTGERRAHQHDRAEHVRPHQRAPGRDRASRNRARPPPRPIAMAERRTPAPARRAPG